MSISVGEWDSIRVGQNRGIEDRVCVLCDGKIPGGTMFVSLWSKGNTIIDSHTSCAGRLSAQLEIFIEKLEKQDAP
jgi:hypothetical protein